MPQFKFNVALVCLTLASLGAIFGARDLLVKSNWRRQSIMRKVAVIDLGRGRAVPPSPPQGYKDPSDDETNAGDDIGCDCAAENRQRQHEAADRSQG